MCQRLFTCESYYVLYFGRSIYFRCRFKFRIIEPIWCTIWLGTSCRRIPFETFLYGELKVTPVRYLPDEGVVTGGGKKQSRSLPSVTNTTLTFVLYQRVARQSGRWEFHGVTGFVVSLGVVVPSRSDTATQRPRTVT